ncbi:hypothetical protein [Kitasatospora griseola]|uniref:hypothetical protein n=1 Tax=Kitasatospora griseola TaxID=2064 RepID=UPI003442FF8B
MGRIGGRWTAVGVSVAALTVLAGAVTPVYAAERNYQAWICSKNSYGKDFTKANVGGYNQNGKYVHTPNFALSDEYEGDIHCGQQDRWWFKPNQTLQINVFNSRSDRWERVYRNFKTQCHLVDKSSRGCQTNFIWR